MGALLEDWYRLLRARRAGARWNVIHAAEAVVRKAIDQVAPRVFDGTGIEENWRQIMVGESRL